MTNYSIILLKEFLIEAKKHTYAGNGKTTKSTRGDSLDLPYKKDDFRYLDSYFGGKEFIGQEIVWYENKAIWGMNYYGTMLIATIPEGFSIFLKKSLSNATIEMPYRGIDGYEENGFRYDITHKGDFDYFHGTEKIYLDDKLIYELKFHGGRIT